MNDEEKGSTKPKKERTSWNLGRKDTVSRWGKKVGRKRKYEKDDEAEEVQRRQQREYYLRRKMGLVKPRGKGKGKENVKGQEEVEVKGEGKVKGESKGDVSRGGEEEKDMDKGKGKGRGKGKGNARKVQGRQGADTEMAINVENEDERRVAGVLSLRRAAQGELSFHTIEEFAVKVDVPADGNCGYYALMEGLLTMSKECKDHVRHMRKDIREFAHNHKEYFNKETQKPHVLDAIFDKSLRYNGGTCLAKRRWMDGSVVFPIASKLYNVIIYVYFDDENETKRTVVYRPCGNNDERGGLVMTLNCDKSMAGKILRLWCRRDDHYNWLELNGLGAQVKSGDGEGLDLNDDDMAVAEMIDLGIARNDSSEKEKEERGVTSITTTTAAAAVTSASVGRVEVDSVPEFEDYRPYPPTVLGKSWWEECLAKDREGGDTSTTISFSAKLGFVCFLGGYPSLAVVSWDDYVGRRNQLQIVPYQDIEFVSEMGRGCRRRKATDAYKPESVSSVRSSPRRRARKRKDTETETGADWQGKMHKINSLLDADDESSRKKGVDMIYAVADELQGGCGDDQERKSIR